MIKEFPQSEMLWKEKRVFGGDSNEQSEFFEII